MDCKLGVNLWAANNESTFLKRLQLWKSRNIKSGIPNFSSSVACDAKKPWTRSLLLAKKVYANFTPGTIGDDHYSRLKDPNIDLFQLLISLYTAHAAADIKQVRVIQARTLTSGPEFTGEAVSLKGISKYHLLVQQQLAKLPYIFT
ncbi:hypothetical protein PoMZ_13539 [Pyricularia oryzae]|uniref:Uncharacterized protein n=1 Tax=Pyricularia oryzae TaxID=318829 RepID=A0A4P7NVD1_PYROR|nr:hypothetical protein PoMZ_13539 [Pyricularia oryzae]